jgi:hypothetical protein
MTRLADRRDQSGSRQWPNAWDRLEALADGMGLLDRFEPLVIIRQPLLQGTKLVIELLEEFPAQRREFGLFRFEGRQESLAEFRHALREDNLVFP